MSCPVCVARSRSRVARIVSISPALLSERCRHSTGGLLSKVPSSPS
jgi:hypothetical protein